MNTKFDVGQRVTYQVVHTADGSITGIAVSKAGVTRYAIGPKWYTEEDLKPSTEDKPITEPADSKPEPVKLYCVKSYDGAFNKWFTRGKTYCISGKKIKFDSEWSLCSYDSLSDFEAKNPDARGCLFPLVRRPAKVGEWVIVTNPHGSHNPIVEKGDTQLVIKEYEDDSVATKCKNVLLEDEYLVLDGYAGDFI